MPFHVELFLRLLLQPQLISVDTRMVLRLSTARFRLPNLRVPQLRSR
jgi:hypothetical protein